MKIFKIIIQKIKKYFTVSMAESINTFGIYENYDDLFGENQLEITKELQERIDNL